MSLGKFISPIGIDGIAVGIGQIALSPGMAVRAEVKTAIPESAAAVRG